jgi:N-acetylglutamate synthase-like GNAT family acetyltransferase
MPVSIRKARQEDAAEIARLQLQLGYSPALEHVAASLSRILARAGERFLIAELDGCTVGCVHAVLTDYVDVVPYVNIAGRVVDAGARREASAGG